MENDTALDINEEEDMDKPGPKAPGLRVKYLSNCRKERRKKN